MALIKAQPEVVCIAIGTFVAGVIVLGNTVKQTGIFSLVLPDAVVTWNGFEPTLTPFNIRVEVKSASLLPEEFNTLMYPLITKVLRAATLVKVPVTDDVETLPPVETVTFCALTRVPTIFPPVARSPVGGTMRLETD